MTTILVVDDNEQNLYQLQVLLGGNGYQVASAANGAKALVIARQNPPDLIVSDILMPVMDGFLLCREWKKDERLKDIPLVFYTATYTDDRDRDFALSLGAEQFLLKPMEPEDLLEAIRSVLRQAESASAAPTQPAADAAARLPAEPPPETEAVYLKEYNEVLVRKLERKMQQLEQANRGLQRDLAERESLEGARTASERGYRRLFESAKDGILILDAQTGMVVDVNPFLLQLLGYSHEQFLGKAIWDLGLFRDVIANQDKFLELQRQEYVRYEHLPLASADGRRIDVEFVSNVYLVGHSRVMQCNIRDITDRRRAEAELSFRTLLLNTQQEASIDGILVVDENARILSFNHRFVDMWGVPPELVEVRADAPVLRFVAEQVANPEPFVRRVQYLYEHARETSRDEIDLRDGRTFDRYSAPMFGSDDRYYGRVWYFRDITERKQAEARMAEQLDELRRWHAATLGREGRVLELKKEVNELLAKAGQPPRYASAVEEEGEKSEVSDH
jgi:PAS domain S-box-containing protein